MRGIGRVVLRGVLLLGLCRGAASMGAVGQSGDEEEMRRLLDRVARGGVPEAALASDELVERVVGRLDAAMALARRSAEERRRIAAAVARIGAAIRVRLYRSELADADRARLDAFVELNPQLVEQVFDDDPRRRRDALGQIPVERDSGASVLALSRLADWDESVNEAAFDLLRQIRDDATGRGLVRFIESALAEVTEGAGARDPDAELAAAMLSGEAILVLGEMGWRAAAPAAVRAMRRFSRTPYAFYFVVGLGRDTSRDVFEALGEMGDEQAIPVLLEYLESRELRANASLGPGELISQTRGDHALLCVLRILKLDAAAFGFKSSTGERPVSGFLTEEGRSESRRLFRKWCVEHGREIPTSQPASGAGRGEPRGGG